MSLKEMLANDNYKNVLSRDFLGEKSKGKKR
jgi:hypothetical protein